MNPPQVCTARLSDKIVHSPKFTEYFFELVQPPVIEFEAGQYASLKVSEHGDRRAYSLTNAPDKNHGFDLLVESVPNGLGSTYLENLQLGSEVQALCPMGLFTVNQSPEESALVFIATGSGIAPYKSMIRHQLQHYHDQRPITLYWGMRQAEHLVWLDDFAELAQTYPNFHFHPVISQALPEWSLCRGRVTDCLQSHPLPDQAGYYLCGSTGMITDVISLLKNQGVAAAQIHHEKFH